MFETYFVFILLGIAAACLIGMFIIMALTIGVLGGGFGGTGVLNHIENLKAQHCDYLRVMDELRDRVRDEETKKDPGRSRDK